MGKYFKDPEPIRTSKYFKNDDFNYREAGLLDIGLKGLKYAPKLMSILKNMTQGLSKTKALLNLPKAVQTYFDDGIKAIKEGPLKNQYDDALSEYNRLNAPNSGANKSDIDDAQNKLLEILNKAKSELKKFSDQFNNQDLGVTAKFDSTVANPFKDDAVELAGSFFKGEIDRPITKIGLERLQKITTLQGNWIQKQFGFSNKIARDNDVKNLLEKTYDFVDDAGKPISLTLGEIFTNPRIKSGILKPISKSKQSLTDDFDSLVKKIDQLEGNALAYGSVRALGPLIKNLKYLPAAGIGLYGVSKVAPTLLPGTRQTIVEEAGKNSKQDIESLNFPSSPLTPPAGDPEIKNKILEYQKAVRDYESATGDDKEFLKIQKDRLESELISKGIDPMQVSSSSTGVFSNLAPSDEASVLSELLSQTAYYTNRLKADPKTNDLKTVLDRFNTTADSLLSQRQISPNVHAVLKDSGTQLIKQIFA